ncbi:MAG: hypothetical protein N4A49_02055 [Marinifilaceae bacterium]|jgi:nicotinamide riboside kinase|nr:hypothetical protein [Marinifilaceae bacterium]
MKNILIFIFISINTLFACNNNDRIDKDYIDKYLTSLSEHLQNSDFQAVSDILTKFINKNLNKNERNETKEYISESIRKLKKISERHRNIKNVSFIKDQFIKDIAFKKIYAIRIGIELYSFEVCFIKNDKNWMLDEILIEYDRGGLYKSASENNMSVIKKRDNDNKLMIDNIMKIFTDNITNQKYKAAFLQLEKFYPNDMPLKAKEMKLSYGEWDMESKVKKNGKLSAILFIDNQVIDDWAYKKIYAFKYQKSIIKFEISFYKNNQTWQMYRYDFKPIKDLYK